MSTNTSAAGVVVLHFGPAPMDFLSRACKLCGKDAVLDPQAAQMAGAVIAAGDPQALAALRARLEAGAIEAAEQQTRGQDLPPGAAQWLGAGERGVSSNTMFTVLTGVDALGDWRKDHPYDPDDFRRCQLLLEAVPALQERLHMMRAESPQWHALVDNWQAICQTFDAESPGWRRRDARWSAPKTYTLMKRILGR